MRQQDYETIVACVKHGAPALEVPLITALNTVIENSNLHIEQQRKDAELARKLEAAKQKKAQDAQKETK